MTDGDDKVRREYRALGHDEPPAALDEAILAASRRAVAPRRAQRWAVPVSLAAVLVLAVGVTLRMQQEQPGIEVSAPASEYPVPPSAAPEPPPAAPAPDRKSQAQPPAPTQKAAPQSPAVDTLAAQSADVQPSARADKGEADAHKPLEKSVVGRDEGTRPQPKAFEERQEIAAAAGNVRQEAPAPPARPATVAPAAAPPAPQAEASAAASAAPQARMKREAKTALADAKDSADPRVRELERIAKLRRDGKDAEADEALARFRREHPDYRIPEAMWEQVKPR